MLYENGCMFRRWIYLWICPFISREHSIYFIQSYFYWKLTHHNPTHVPPRLHPQPPDHQWNNLPNDPTHAWFWWAVGNHPNPLGNLLLWNENWACQTRPQRLVFLWPTRGNGSPRSSVCYSTPPFCRCEWQFCSYCKNLQIVSIVVEVSHWYYYLVLSDLVALVPGHYTN